MGARDISKYMSYGCARDVYVLSGRPMAALLDFLCALLLGHWCSRGGTEVSSLDTRSTHYILVLMESYTPYTPTNIAPDMVAEFPLGLSERRTVYGSPVSAIPVLKLTLQPRAATEEQRTEWEFALAEAISVNSEWRSNATLIFTPICELL